MADPHKGFGPDKFELWREIAQAVGLTIREVSVKGYTWYEAASENLLTGGSLAQGQFHTGKGGFLHFGTWVALACGYEPNPYPHKEGRAR